MDSVVGGVAACPTHVDENAIDAYRLARIRGLLASEGTKHYSFF